MIRILGEEYDGYIASNADERITVILHTWKGFEDIVAGMTTVKSIESVKDGKSTVFNVTAPVSAQIVGANLYSIVFTTKLAATEALMQRVNEQYEIIREQADTIRELSDAVDQLLVEVLEV